MDKDTLHWYEKTALGLAMSAQALVIMQWYLDGNYPADWLRTVLQWMVVVVAVAAGIALDAVVVTTVMGRREGRDSLWGWLTAGSAAIFSALVALHMSGGWSAGAWLHVAYPVTTFLFAQHLSTPRKVAQTACQDCAAHTQYIADLTQAMDEQERALRTATQERDENEAQALRRTTEADVLRRENTQLRQSAAQPLRIDKALVVAEYRRLRTHHDSARKAADAMGINEATLRSWDVEVSGTEQAARNGHAKEVLA